MKKLLITMICLCTLLSASKVMAAYVNFGSRTHMNSFGLSFETGTSPAGINLSYTNGECLLLGYFLQGDLGYSFREKSIDGRFGGAFVFILIGIEAGALGSYSLVDENKYFDDGNSRFAPAFYAGLVVLALDKHPGTFSVGANIYGMNRDNEFYIRLTLPLNFYKYL